MNGQCVAKLCGEGNLEGILEQRKSLWGTQVTPAPKTRERRKKLWDLQTSFWNSAEQRFDYHFLRPGAPSGQKPTVVCEAAWLHLIGLRGITQQFRDNVKMISRGEEFESGLKMLLSVIFCVTLPFFSLLAYSTSSDTKREGRMGQKCRTFIAWFRDNNCDQLPAHKNVETGEPEATVWVLPFTNISHFFCEYEAYCLALGEDEEIASYQTFRRTYLGEFAQSLRKMRCKGNFSHSCGICNGGMLVG
jgi:hypothetical protein